MVGTNNVYENEMPTKIQSAGVRAGTNSVGFLELLMGAEDSSLDMSSPFRL